MSRLKESGSSPTDLAPKASKGLGDAIPSDGLYGLEEESLHGSSAAGGSIRYAHRKLAPSRNWILLL